MKTQLIIFLASLLCIIQSCSNGSSSPSKVQIMEQQDTTFDKVIKTDSEWQKILSDEEYRILRKKGTEPPFSGKYNKFYEEGIYVCAGCEFPLFSSKAKYDSKTGWPSFWEPINKYCIKYVEDRSLGMIRDEVLCARCEGHLGHVFDDGPKPTGLRYCINSVALKFIPEKNRSIK